MAVFSTGLTQLPDVGLLAYNGCTFSSLFRSKASWRLLPDNAGRAAKLAELSIEAEGYVTLDVGGVSTDDLVTAMKLKLAEYGGTLTYQGRGFGKITVNAPGGPVLTQDCNWGPKTELLDFKPLGGGAGALATWRVTTWITPYELTASLSLPGLGGSPGGQGPLVQFNEETSNAYDEDCYSTFSVRGTMEIPLTRGNVNSTVVSDTVDSFRRRFLDFTSNQTAGIDLTRFRVARRSFNVSRDKRTCEWEFVLEEIPFMPLPPGCPTARGTYSVSPAMPGKNRFGINALMAWNCSLSCTYTVAPSVARRVALAAFLSLLQWRMTWGSFGVVPGISQVVSIFNQPPPGALPAQLQQALNAARGQDEALGMYAAILKEQQQRVASIARTNERKTWLYHFGFREGLYLDSRTVTFEASWKMLTTLTHVMIASGAWRWPQGTLGGNLWAQSVKGIQGWKGNLSNVLDPDAEIIISLDGV